MIPDPPYLLLKLKGVAKVCIEVVKGRKKVPEVNSGKIWRGLPRSESLRIRFKRIEFERSLLEPLLRGLALVAIFVLFLSFGIKQAVPVDNEWEEFPAFRPTLLVDAPPPPKITARSAYLLDLRSGFVLYDKNSALRLPSASATKIATALVVLANYDLDGIVEVPSICTFRTEESLMGLFPDERISVRNLLRGLLIASASDAACVLAGHHQEGIVEFVNEMNNLVAALKLDQTHFVNPSGLDSAFQYSTARELTVLARKALSDQFFRTTVRTEELNIASVDKERWHRLETTNELLGKMPGILGVKTGYTAKAKEVLVFYFKRGEKELLGTVMGSDDQFGETKVLLNWVLSSFLFPLNSGN